MRYSDIPKYTSCGNYSVHHTLDYFVDWIQKQKEELSLELNPDFQRGHVWTELQQVKYIEHILAGGKTSIEFYFNQAGWMNDFEGEFVCVDGLQRITSIQKFINNEIKAFGYYLDEYENKDVMLRKIHIIVNVNNLKTRKEVLKWYIEFNSGGTIHTEEEINRVKELLDKEK